MWVSASFVSGGYGYTYGSYTGISGVSVKGGHPKGNAVLLNGVLINQPQSSYADLSDVSPFLFGNMDVFEGGFTPYSIYGNISFYADTSRKAYLQLNHRMGLSFGYKNKTSGFDAGNLIGDRDTFLFMEGMLNLKESFWDVRVSRKKTPGMENFPNLGGIQSDLRVAGRFKDISIVLLGREWNGLLDTSRHTNFRIYRSGDINLFKYLLIFEGVSSSNLGKILRPIVYISRNGKVLSWILGGNVWTDGRRLGGGMYANTAFWGMVITLNFSSRIPSFDELYWEGANARGNPNLRNEKNFGFSALRRLRFAKFEGFFRRFYDIIEWENVGGIWRPMNSGGGRVWGYTVSIGSKNIKVKYDRIWAYYDNGKRMIYRPRNTYAAYLRFWKFHTNILYLDPRFTNTSNTRFINHLLQMDVSFSMNYKFATLIFSITNLLNRKDMFIEGYPLNGRTYTLTLKFGV